MLSFSASNSMEGKRYDKALERAIVKALEEAGVILEGEAAMRVPVDTGRLKGSITYATRTARSYARGMAGPVDEVSAPHDAYTAHVGTNVDYAQHIEYGTVRSPAQPYLRPALANRRGSVTKIVRDTIREAMRRGR